MAIKKSVKVIWDKTTKRQLFVFSASLVASKWLLMSIISLLCGTVVLIYTAFFVTPIYSATTKILALKSDVDVTLVDENVNISNKVIKDFVVLAKTDKTLDYVLNDADMPAGYTKEKILSEMNIVHNEESNIISITVRDPSADNAAYLANTLATGLQTAINNLLLDTITDYDQLSSIYEKAVVNTSPVYPNIPLSVGIALLLGFLLTFLLITAIVILSNDIISPEQILVLTNLGTIGNIVMFDFTDENNNILPSE